MADDQDPARDDVAVDEEGNRLPFSPQRVREIVLQMINDGQIEAVLIRVPNGEIAVQVFGPPSQELLDVFNNAARALGLALAKRN